MKEKDFETLTNSMQEKLGKEYASKIADDLGTLITDNAAINKELKQKDEMIAKLRQDKENLIQVNGNLLQQVAMGEEPKDEEPKQEQKQPFDFRTAFDEYGNFKI
jgi:hypothetical protein